MRNDAGGFGSPFLDPETDHADEAPRDWSPQLAQLLFESPFVRQGVRGAPIALERGAEALEDQFAEEEAEIDALAQECEDCGGNAHGEAEIESERDGTDEEAPSTTFEAEAPPAALGNDQRNWVLSLDRSAIEKLPDPALRRHYLEEVDWRQIEFPSNVPRGEKESAEIRAHWQLAEELFGALASVTPERRVPLGPDKIKFHVRHVEPVPGQKGHQLVPEAVEAFVRMRATAALEGVKLVITSSWRSAQQQADLSAGQPNAKAVAKGNSAHMYGLALDISMAVPGLDFSGKSNTRTAEKMAKLVRMYRSPVYKWLMLRGRSFGWYPYRREPWHWEYNPPGFKARFEGKNASTPPSSPAPAAPTAGMQPAELVRFAQRVLNACEGERLSDDGDLGRLTRAALARFRSKHQLGAGSMLDTKTALALVQRALEQIAQASLFARVGTSDARTDQAIAAFRAEHGLGFGAVLDAATRSALTDALAARRAMAPTSAPVAPPKASTTTPASYLGGKLWTFRAQTLSTSVAVFCPKAAAGQSEVDVLVYAHGLLNGCRRPKSLPDGIVTDDPFELGRIVDASNRAVVLVVPLLDWEQPGGAPAFGKNHPHWNALAKPQNLNALLGEVMFELSRVQTGATSTLRQLAVAGHSRAYDFLEPLAFLHGDAHMQQGALAKLSQVWALDTTYAGDVDLWAAWLAANPALQAHFFYRNGTKTGPVGDRFFARRGGRLFVTKCAETHCALPARRLPGLLSGPAGDHEVSDEFALENEDFEADESGDEREVLAEADFEDPPLSEALVEDEDFLLNEAERDGTDEEDEFEFEEEDAAEATLEFEDETGGKAPLAVPHDHPVPFAPEPPSGSFWPVRTTHPQARVVSYLYSEPKGIEGAAGRMFLASRQGKRNGMLVARRHVGVDLYAHVGDEVVACESGTIVAFDFFYKAKSGQRTYKLMVENDTSGIVVNYGEVKSDSLSKHGLKLGSQVVAGQPIAFVSDTSMIHFEAYVKGTTTTHRWWKDESKAPSPLLNPTRYLCFLRDHGLAPGTGAAPSATAPSSAASAPPTTAGSEQVRFAQRVLNAIQGTKLDDDGKLGRLTLASLTQFRQMQKLGAGGVLDDSTLLALAQRALEQLAQQSIFAQPGTLDARTKEALAGFRAEHGLGSDARLDNATRTALTDALARHGTPASPTPAVANTSTGSGSLPALGAGLTPPSHAGAYRKFRLTTYHVVDQADEPTGAVRVPILDLQGNKLADGSPAFFAKLSLEGTGRLSDGRLINVTGKTVPVSQGDYAEVLAYHRKAYARSNEKRHQQGRAPVSTQYSGISVDGDRVTRAFAFHVVDTAKLGAGYGMARGVPYTPFRTLAADIGHVKYSHVEPKWKGQGGVVPPGTQVYIKEYDGLHLPDGSTHDGWFIVNDTGGAIFGAHFDVFTGSDALRKQLKLPEFGQVWFPGIEDRVPAGYTYGLTT